MNTTTVLLDPFLDRGVLALAAAASTPEAVALLVRYGSGYLQVGIGPAVRSRLRLHRMSGTGPDSRALLSVDLAAGSGTGISAHDRSATIRALARPDSGPDDFHHPGHVPVVLVPELGSAPPRARAAAAALRLAAASTGVAVAAFTDLVDPADPLRMADVAAARRFAHRHGLPVVDISETADLARCWPPAGDQAGVLATAG
ncbi:3,4-dihydroxy-2-butanone-4-phosphate synthase [Nakamurella alba]|nr:3,4-dihydroxy-2-butanone-4-phosphate synthase [Nakamurella alba]